MPSPGDILQLFRRTGALLEGHFQLTSGLHSPTYFQCARVLQFPEHSARLCSGIVEHFRRRPVALVIAPAIGGIVVGQEVGRQMGVRSIFAERVNGVLQLRRGFEIAPGEQALVVEDVVTTGGSTREVIRIVLDHGAAVAGVGAIVDRSGGRGKFDDFFAALTMEAVTYDPTDCPLCRQGIPVDKPGSRGMLNA